MRYIKFGIVFIILGCLRYGTLLFAEGNKLHQQMRRHATPPSPTIPANVNIADAVPVQCDLVTSSVRRVELSDESMIRMFKARQGSYVTDYMAATADEATEFPNMLELTAPLLTPYSQQLNLSIADNVITKATIMEDMSKLQLWVNAHFKNIVPTTSTRSTGSYPSTNTPNTGHIHQNTQVKYINNTLHDNNSIPLPNIAATMVSTKSAFLTKSKAIKTTSDPDSTINITTTTANPSKSALTTSASDASTMNMTSHKTTETTGSGSTMPTTTGNDVTDTLDEHSTQTSARNSRTTVDPDVAQSLLAFQKYLAGETTGLDTVWRQANTTVHPRQLLGIVPGSRRRKRNADGSVSREEYCQVKGSMTDDGYLHMCKTCSVTTTLPEGHFPQYINEAVCAKDDNTCLTVGDTAHGLCKQRTFTLNMMRKRPGSCLIINDNGSNIVLDDWELYPQPIRVCCECAISKLSIFSQYVAPSVPVG